MSYKKRHIRLELGLDLAFSLALFLILVISNFAGSSLSGTSLSKTDLNEIDLKTYCCDYPQVPGSEGIGMTSDGLPVPKEPAFITLPCILNPDNSGKKVNDNKYCKPEYRLQAITTKKICCLATSTSKISSELSHQFTLVGAKPSGTS